MANTLQRQIITRALELISADSNWTGGTLARDSYRRSCSVASKAAVRFCAVGALSRASLELLGTLDAKLVAEIEADVLAANGLDQLSLASINDRAGREIVVTILQNALRRTGSRA